MSAKCWDLAYPSQKYVRTMGQTVEKVILTTVCIWKTTYNPVYMDNRAYLEIACMNLKVCPMRLHIQIGQVHNPPYQVNRKGHIRLPCLAFP